MVENGQEEGGILGVAGSSYPHALIESANSEKCVIRNGLFIVFWVKNNGRWLHAGGPYINIIISDITFAGKNSEDR